MDNGLGPARPPPLLAAGRESGEPRGALGPAAVRNPGSQESSPGVGTAWWNPSPNRCLPPGVSHPVCMQVSQCLVTPLNSHLSVFLTVPQLLCLFVQSLRGLNLLAAFTALVWLIGTTGLTGAERVKDGLGQCRAGAPTWAGNSQHWGKVGQK